MSSFPCLRFCSWLNLALILPLRLLRCHVLSIFYFRSFWLAPKIVKQGLHQVALSMHPYIQLECVCVCESVLWWFEVFVAWGCSGRVNTWLHLLQTSTQLQHELIRLWPFNFHEMKKATHYIQRSNLMFCRIARHQNFNQVTVLIVASPCRCCCCWCA